MKIGIDSYCYHRLFGDVYDMQEQPEKLATIEDVISTSTHFVLRKYKDNNIIYGSVPVDERGNDF